MSSGYNKYQNYNQGTFNAENKQIQEFFAVLKEIKDMTYEERVKYIDEKWGEITDTKVICYGTKCKIKLYRDKEKKYHMDFETLDIPKEYFDSFTLGLINKITEDIKTKFYKEHPELKHSDVKTSSNSDADYLRLYNNINVNKNK